MYKDLNIIVGSLSNIVCPSFGDCCCLLHLTVFGTTHQEMEATRDSSLHGCVDQNKWTNKILKDLGERTVLVLYM